MRVRERIKYLINKGFFHIFVGNTIVKLLTFLIGILLVRVLTKEDFGVLSYTDNVLSFFLLITGLGTSTSILRYMSLDNTLIQKKSYIKYGLKLGLSINIILTILFFIFISTKTLVFYQAKYYLLLLILYPTLYYLFDYSIMLLRGFYLNKEYSVITMLYSLVLIVLVLFLSKYYAIKGVILARYLTLAIFIICIYIKLRGNIIRNEEAYVLSQSEKKEFFSYSFYSVLANGLSMMLPLNEGIIVNNFFSSAEISANYKTATQLPVGIQFVMTSLIIFLFPYFSKNSNNKKWLRNKSATIMKITIPFFIFLLIFFVSTTELWVSVLYGNNYRGIVPLMKIYWVVFIINAAFRMLPGNILSAIGEAKFNTLNAFFTLVVHFILTKLFINNFGIIGVPISLLLTYFMSGTVSWFYFLKLTKENKK